MKKEFPKMIYKKSAKHSASQSVAKSDYCVVKSEKEMLALGDEWNVDRPNKRRRQAKIGESLNITKPKKIKMSDDAKAKQPKSIFDGDH